MWPHEKPEAHFTSHKLLLDKACNIDNWLVAIIIKVVLISHQLAS